MYTLSDPRVLEMLQRVVSTYTRTGDFLNFEAKPESLTISTINSSQTVLAKVKLVKPLFEGEGTLKTVQVKARALDMILRRLETDQVSMSQLEFAVTRTGQEQVRVCFVGLNDVSKIFVLPSLHVAVLPVDFEPVGPDPFSFECLPSVSREAFASCGSGADESQIMFRPQLISLLAQKRGSKAKKKPGNSNGMSSNSSKLTVEPGLKTLIKSQFDSFQQITASAPRQLDMKFREFRTMLSFLDHICEGNPLRAEFRGTSSSTPVVFRGKFAAFPTVEFVFKFMSRFTAPRTDSATWVRVGPQGTSLNNAEVRREAEAAATFEEQQALLSAQREREQRVRNIMYSSRRSRSEVDSLRSDSVGTDRATSDVAGDVTGDVRMEFDETGEQSFEEAPPSPEEIGFTQPPNEVHGLFD